MRRAIRAIFGAALLGGLLLLPAPVSSQSVAVAGPRETASPSSPSYDVRWAMNVPVPMRDGVRLATDLYLPDAEGRFPVVLVRTPYGSETPRFAEQGRFYAARGYVFAVQDARGKYDSEGDWYGRRSERDDTDDTITWVGTQAWSSGDVGMVGASYGGLVQMMVAPAGNPHLKALIPEVTPVTLGRTPESWRRLAVYGRGNSAPSELSWLVTTDGRVNQNGSAYDWTELFRHLPLAELPARMGREIPIWEKLIRNEIGLWEEYLESAARNQWTEPIADWPDHRELYRAVEVPILQRTGWFDASTDHAFHNREQVVRHSETGLARAQQHLLIGPWPHAYSGSSTIGALDFGEASVLDLPAVHLRWFDRWLKGVDNGVDREAPLRLFVMGRNEWREAWEWPLPETEFVPFYLHSGGGANSNRGDGVLAREPPGDEPPDRYRYDPGDPTPAITGGENAEMAGDGPVDVGWLEARDDVLTYTTGPLEEEVEITGPVSATLYVASSAPETEFIVRMVDVHPDGSAYPVWYSYANAFGTRGIEPVGATAEGHRIWRLEFDLPPTSQAFLPGHRIRVQITSAAFPLFRHLNTDGDPAWETEWRVAEQTVFHDGERASRVVLPVRVESPPKRDDMTRKDDQ
ncbi:MAG: CocE/NonD family hydrolase [Gemmatimonadetes bacterium]|nr:CocE/NonD family hydrolase [Gemmatimonadota bacterium]